MNISPSPNLNIKQALTQATAYHQTGRLAQAEQIYRQILQQNPQQVEALNLLGVISCQHGRFDEGIALYRQALALKPEFTMARENLCLALWKQGGRMVEEAVTTLTQIITYEPKNLQAYENLGTILLEQNKLNEALHYYHQGLQVQPDNPRLLNNIGTVLQQQGKSRQAIAYHRKALAIQPNFPDALVGLGTALQNQAEFAEAMTCLDRAVAVAPGNPVARYNRALLYLVQGDFVEGFAEYEWRFQTGDFPACPFQQPVWDGGALKGRTLLLHAEQGMGDTIQFIRYAAIAAQKGGRVILTCHEPLIKLLSTLPGIDQIIPLGHPLPPFDTYAPLLSLPRILGTSLETVPDQVPYIPVPPSEKLLETPPNTRLKVGIVWAGGVLYKHNQSRSCPLEHFQPLLQVPQVTFYSLQKGLYQADLQELGWESQVPDLGREFKSMADTAAAIAQLDLVITVDTVIAHLAGSLGKPVWTLLPAQADWRWMIDRDDSPWYPTMRLFRQQQPGDWAGVMQRVEQEIRGLPYFPR